MIPAGLSDKYSHGTSVASVAAGRSFGVAPGANIAPVAIDFSSNGQRARRAYEYFKVFDADPEVKAQYDTLRANRIPTEYKHFDIINRSHGVGAFNPEDVVDELGSFGRWWGEYYRQAFPVLGGRICKPAPPQPIAPLSCTQPETKPKNTAASVQGCPITSPWHGGLFFRWWRRHPPSSPATSNPRTPRTVIFAAPYPPTGTNTGGGGIFCLAAPGRVNSASNANAGQFKLNLEGTSFAAPIVSGALALMMEHFRGQLGNDELVKRMVNTANNSGPYAQVEIYGAGLLDLEAALNPIGEVSTGTPAWHGPAALSVLNLPPAIGGLGQRLSEQGVEVAGVDRWGAPFWTTPRTPHVSDRVGAAHIDSDSQRSGEVNNGPSRWIHTGRACPASAWREWRSSISP